MSRPRPKRKRTEPSCGNVLHAKWRVTGNQQYYSIATLRKKSLSTYSEAFKHLKKLKTSDARTVKLQTYLCSVCLLNCIKKRRFTAIFPKHVDVEAMQKKVVKLITIYILLISCSALHILPSNIHHRLVVKHGNVSTNFIVPEFRISLQHKSWVFSSFSRYRIF